MLLSRRARPNSRSIVVNQDARGTPDQELNVEVFSIDSCLFNSWGRIIRLNLKEIIKKELLIMFEITFNDREKLEILKKNRKAYSGSKYDFTLEDRYLVYHCPLKQNTVYIALDLETGCGSEVMSVKNEERFTVHSFERLLPLVLYSIKYTGDRRYRTVRTQDGYMIIEYIFKVVLPEYGYQVRSEQIALCKSMYEGFMTKVVTELQVIIRSSQTRMDPHSTVIRQQASA